jgi:hypothetical protein
VAGELELQRGYRDQLDSCRREEVDRPASMKLSNLKRGRRCCREEKSWKNFNRSSTHLWTIACEARGGWEAKRLAD